MQVCALKTLLHNLWSEPNAAAWVAYVKPFVGTAVGGEESVSADIASLCDKYQDAFEQHWLPVTRDVDHCANLLNEAAKPPRPCQYQLSGAESAEV